MPWLCVRVPPAARHGNPAALFTSKKHKKKKMRIPVFQVNIKCGRMRRDWRGELEKE